MDASVVADEAADGVDEPLRVCHAKGEERLSFIAVRVAGGQRPSFECGARVTDDDEGAQLGR
eukprot:6851191-Prymnesium_polylepis.1